MTKNEQKKRAELGMPLGTAMARLKKSILFSLLKELNKDICCRCGKRILTEKELSIDHIAPWQGAGVEKFWDLSNIGYAHLRCNSAAARRPTKGINKHPSLDAYKRGCRCAECKKLNTLKQCNYRSRVGQKAKS